MPHIPGANRCSKLLVAEIAPGVLVVLARGQPAVQQGKEEIESVGLVVQHTVVCVLNHELAQLALEEAEGHRLLVTEVLLLLAKAELLRFRLA